MTDPLRTGLDLARMGADVGIRITSWGVRTSTRITARLLQAASGRAPTSHVARQPKGATTDAATLRERGADLLRRSVDLDYEEPFHPAYARILDLLAPDEARILRYLAIQGPAAAVDVRATPIGARSEMLAPGISLIGERAGCRFPDRVPGYLNNLYRLGLIWFSREPLEPREYEMLEAQPSVQRALKQVRRARTVRRSIELTPFGSDFCAICLPTEDVI